LQDKGAFRCQKEGQAMRNPLFRAVCGFACLGLALVAPAGAQPKDVGVDVVAPSKDWGKSKSGERLNAAACAQALSKLDTWIEFTRGSVVLWSRQRADVEAAGALLRRCDGVRITVSGYTDKSGPSALNMSLSEQRANAVAEVLVRSGVAEPDLQIDAYGETQPSRGVPANAVRRVEISVAPK
jgi:outer membrane protein OmpA-like peptidoglycan-associated protein